MFRKGRQGYRRNESRGERMKEWIKQLFCKHSYKKTDAKPIRTYYDYDGNKVGVFVCMCRKCGNVKKKRFWNSYNF